MTPLGYFDGFCRDYRHYKGGSWCYEDGCVYRGLELLYRATGEGRWFDHLIRLTDHQIGADGSLRGYTVEEFNIDHVLAGRVLFFLMAETGEARYRRAADLLASQLVRHPRIEAGNYWHKLRYPHQVWLDGLYMGLPFQIEYGQATGDEALVADAVGQLLRALDLTASGQGLYAHGYDASRDQAWCDPATGLSSNHWGRALGWLAMALVDSCELLQGVEPRLAGAAAALLDRLAGLQTASGLWLQVIDQADLPGNYEETSASAMIAYALMRADRTGLRADAGGNGRRALDRLTGSRLVGGPEGARLEGICLVAGLGGFSGVYRDGSAEYYLSEPVVSDDAKGVGPLMMAVAEGAMVGARRAAAV